MTVAAVVDPKEAIRLRKEGKTLQEIGDHFGVTRERIRQVLKKHAPRLNQGRIVQQRKDAADQMAVNGALARAEEITRWYREERINQREIAARLGIGLRLTREVLDELIPKRERDLHRGGVNLTSYTDEELLDALRKARDAVGEPLTTRKYEEYVTQLRRRARRRPAISIPANPQTHMKRFGSWTEACRRAGVEPGVSNRSEFERQWDEDDCIEVVWTMADEIGRIPTAAEYADWARDQQEWCPSLPSLRSIIPWHEIVRKLLEEGYR